MVIKNLLIWRHADAELADIACSESEDMARALTLKGKRQARLIARWLQNKLPKNVTVISSPALRALQTADALNMPIQLEVALKPSANVQEVLAVLESAAVKHQHVLIVGHQPWLGALVAHLISSADTDTAFSIKKGAIWWLRPSAKELQTKPAQTSQAPYQAAYQAPYTVHTVQTPNLMR